MTDARYWHLIGSAAYVRFGDSLRAMGYEVIRHPSLKDVWCFR